MKYELKFSLGDTIPTMNAKLHLQLSERYPHD